MTVTERADGSVTILDCSGSITLGESADVLKDFGVSYKVFVASAHRSPARVEEIVKSSGADVFIAMAGVSAALPGAVAAITTKPVIGVPVSGKVNLDAANLMVFKAATLYDNKQPCGIESNAAKYLAAEAGFDACETAILTHGGMGYSKEFHVERYLREVMLTRIAPISRELIMSNIAERQLGLPKSY